MIGEVFAGLCAGAIVMDWINQSEIKKLEKQNDDLGLHLHNMGYEIRKLMEESDKREVKLKELMEESLKRSEELDRVMKYHRNNKKSDNGEK